MQHLLSFHGLSYTLQSSPEFFSRRNSELLDPIF